MNLDLDIYLAMLFEKCSLRSALSSCSCRVATVQVAALSHNQTFLEKNVKV